eukprot:1420972-Heterocapsa_arctica.AAC.1
MGKSTGSPHGQAPAQGLDWPGSSCQGSECAACGRKTQTAGPSQPALTSTRGAWPGHFRT